MANTGLRFINTRAHEISGVIVDLNLTDGHDNFGRTLLERLRDIGMPCVVFSSSIKSPADAARYANEFGVLGTIGKEATGAGASPLDQLRSCVAKMLTASLEQLRERVRDELERELATRDELIEQDGRKTKLLVEETERVAGKKAAEHLAAIEAERIEGLRSESARIRNDIVTAIAHASTEQELLRLRTDLPRALGVI